VDKKKRMKRVSLNKRIAWKCLDCAAGSPKEVTLCHLFDCPLWAMRTGRTIRDKSYVQRIKDAEKNFAQDIEELRKMGIKIEDFYKEHPISVTPKS